MSNALDTGRGQSHLEDGVDALAAELVRVGRGAARGREEGEGLWTGVDCADELHEGLLVDCVYVGVELHPEVGREGDLLVLDGDVCAVWGGEGGVRGVGRSIDALRIVRMYLGGGHGARGGSRDGEEGEERQPLSIAIISPQRACRHSLL
jgi:hypothetical protein